MQYFEYNECKQRGTFDFPIEIYHIDPQHPQYNMSYHWHKEYEIIRILDGTIELFLDERKWIAKKGDVIIINNGTLHRAIPSNCIYECIVFDMNMLLNKNDFCQPFIDKLMNHTYLFHEYHPYCTSRLHQGIDLLFYEMSQQSLGYQLMVKSYLYQLLGNIFRESCFLEDLSFSIQNGKKISQLKHALDIIETQYATPLSLENISKSVGMSPKYFCKFFKEMTHKSLIEYINDYRIEHACYQLLHSDFPITSIAHNCGFNDFSYFIKTFKRYKNTTPKQYRIQNQMNREDSVTEPLRNTML